LGEGGRGAKAAAYTIILILQEGRRRSVGERRGKGVESREQREGGEMECRGQQAPVDAVISPSHVQHPLYGRLFLPRTTVWFRAPHDTLSRA